MLHPPPGSSPYLTKPPCNMVMLSAVGLVNEDERFCSPVTVIGVEGAGCWHESSTKERQQLQIGNIHRARMRHRCMLAAGTFFLHVRHTYLRQMGRGGISGRHSGLSTRGTARFFSH